MPIEQTLVPVHSLMVYDNKEIPHMDAKLSMYYDNGTTYEECMTSSGKKGYLLRKGSYTKQEGDIFIVIPKTGDKKNDETIQFLQSKLQEIAKSEDPNEYSKSVVYTCQDPGENQFLSLSFSGYIKELRVAPPKEGNAFTDYIAEFEIFDVLTVNLTN